MLLLQEDLMFRYFVQGSSIISILEEPFIDGRTRKASAPTKFVSAHRNLIFHNRNVLIVPPQHSVSSAAPGAIYR